MPIKERGNYKDVKKYLSMIICMMAVVQNIGAQEHISSASDFVEVMKGRTSIVIAHRLSTIRDADLIVVLDQGRIVEQGSHDELLARKQKYYDLYMTQYAGFAT